MIHVCYGLYDKDGKYSKFVGTSMTSIFENTSADVTVHILHDNTLTVDNRDKFVYVAGRYNQQVKFYNVEESCKQEITNLKHMFPKESLERFSIGTAFRLFAPKIIANNIDKIIYLDCDVIVNLDIKEMWQIELDNKPLAAVLEWEDSRISQQGLQICRDGLVKGEDYFNAGVIIINLSRWRTDNSQMQKKLTFITNNPKYHLFDQDFLNYCFSTQYLKLPSKFNCWVRRERSSGVNTIQRKVYHFIGQGDSLGLNMQDNFHRLYFEYFTKTPWFNIDMLDNIANSFIQTANKNKTDLLQLTKALSGKVRAFFTEPQNSEAIKQIFAVNPNEELITPPLHAC